MNDAKIGVGYAIEHPKFCPHCLGSLNLNNERDSFTYKCIDSSCKYLEVIHHQKCIYGAEEEIRYWKMTHKPEL